MHPRGASQDYDLKSRNVTGYLTSKHCPVPAPWKGVMACAWEGVIIELYCSTTSMIATYGIAKKNYPFADICRQLVCDGESPLGNGASDMLRGELCQSADRLRTQSETYF